MFLLLVPGCPRVLRTDMGSENSLIAVFQPLLRHAHMDGNSGSNSHHYGRSTFNQVCTCILLFIIIVF